jgi:hypothetical protein
VTSLPEPLDVLDDANDCTIDSCVGLEPTANPHPTNTPCILGDGAAGVCDGEGKCVECRSDSHCPPEAPKCNTKAYVCVPPLCTDTETNGAETDQNCGGPDCAPCDQNKKCLVASDCLEGVCGALGTCADSTCDDGVENENETDIDCGAGCPTNCAPGQGCNSDGDCHGNQCTGKGGVCVPNCQDLVKNNAESDIDCGGGVCTACKPGKACGGFGGNCLSGVCGPTGTCEIGALGTACTAGTDCASNVCAQGVCCDTNCTASCKSCSLPGSVGTCTNVPAGQDPKNACLNACDGNGACQ